MVDRNIRKRIEQLEAESGVKRDREQQVQNLATFLGVTIEEILEVTQGRDDLRYSLHEHSIEGDKFLTLFALTEPMRRRRRERDGSPGAAR